jgi:hypothetical protein
VSLAISLVGAGVLVAITLGYMARRPKPARDRDVHRGDWPPEGMAR